MECIQSNSQVDELELCEEIVIKIPLRCRGISLKDVKFLQRYDEICLVFFIFKEKNRNSLQLPRWLNCWNCSHLWSSNHIPIQKQNVYEEEKKKFEDALREIFYLEIKPPPTGRASRIDDCSLREVTTCCQTVLASRLVLLGLRL